VNRFGYVEFFDRDGVHGALSMSGRQFMGQTVTVKPTEAEKNRSAANALTTTYFGPTRLYVGSLHFNVTEDDVRSAFERWGSIEFVDIHKDPETGRSKGFGFVQ
jgi:RNA-binding protein 39